MKIDKYYRPVALARYRAGQTEDIFVEPSRRLSAYIGAGGAALSFTLFGLAIFNFLPLPRTVELSCAEGKTLLQASGEVNEVALFFDKSPVISDLMRLNGSSGTYVVKGLSGTPCERSATKAKAIFVNSKS